jgi:hypothetical protein
MAIGLSNFHVQKKKIDLSIAISDSRTLMSLIEEGSNLASLTKEQIFIEACEANSKSYCMINFNSRILGSSVTIEDSTSSLHFPIAVEKYKFGPVFGIKFNGM